MATKSKKYKHSSFFKALCFILSVLFFALSAVSVLICGHFVEYTDELTDIFSKEKLPEFRQSNTFYGLVYEYVYNTTRMSLDVTSKQVEAKLMSEKDAVIDSLTEAFLTKKAEIIRSELYYVATHYEREYENDYYYEAYNDLVNTTTTTTAVSDESNTESTTFYYEKGEEDVTEPVETTRVDINAKVAVDPYAPYNVRYCQHLLNTVSGLDFLQYENLVRDEALTNYSYQFNYDTESFNYYTRGHSCSASYDNSEEDVRNMLSDSFDQMVEYVQYRYVMDMEEYKYSLSSVKNYKYILINGDKVYSNLPKKEQVLQNIAHHDIYGIYKDGMFTSKGLDDCPYGLEATINDTANGSYALYFYIEDDFIPSDSFYDSAVVYELYSEIPPVSVVVMAVWYLVLSIIFLIVLIKLCGHKAGSDEVHLALIDKIPCDIHFVAVAGLCLAAVAGWFVAGEYLWRAFPTDRSVAVLHIVFTAVLAGASWALVAEWVTSFARLVKCKKPNSIIRKLFVICKKLILKLITLIKKTYKLILYKNVKLSVLTTVGIVLYFAINVFLTFLLLNSDFGWIIVLIPFNVAVIILVLLVMRHLDRIIVASENIGEPIPDTDKMPGALKLLAENISQTNNNLQKAVEQTVKNERMKTDLITNVSHDLRTPLTAIISYVGLLENCDISDPTAKEYLSVLSEKSEKLKQLINDLIEASKVSSGNITLNLSKLNLSELVVQAIVEATPEFEKNGLDIRFTDYDTSPTVYADSAKTYRIIENLLSNARKYSAENSRVYITVSESDSYGIFEIKNISSEPLNIDANELMERFIRGDKSRTRDGNGLGLSIAKDLCMAQNGKLTLSIDGDLFKATVYLPKK